MASAKVIVTKRFRGYALEVDRRCDRALGKAAAAGVAAARATPTRYNIGEILNSIVATPARERKGGREVSIVAGDWRATMFELGTYTRRRRKLKQPRRTSRPNKGVRAGYFLNRGVKAARPLLLSLLGREIGSIP